MAQLIGITSSLGLLVVSFTGVYMQFPDYVKPLVTWFSAETQPPTDLKSVPGEALPLTPEEAAAIAKEQFPDASFDHLHPPEGESGTYEIGLRQPGEVTRSFGRTQVWIDPYNGAILAVRDPRAASFADSFIAWQFPLHNGEAFGLIGRWIVFICGLTPAVLYVTGLLVWWRKAQARRRQRSRRPLRRRNAAHTPVLDARPAKPTILSPVASHADELWSHAAAKR